LRHPLRRGDERRSRDRCYRFFAAFFVAFLAVVFAAAFLAAFFAIRPPWLAVLAPVSRHWPITTGGLSYPASHKM
jgi:hypothetical protein